MEEKIKKYFWDTNFKLLDPQKDEKYILERILEMGDDNAVNWIFKTYPRQNISNTLKNNRKISPKSSNFWNFILSQ